MRAGGGFGSRGTGSAREASVNGNIADAGSNADRLVQWNTCESHKSPIDIFLIQKVMGTNPTEEILQGGGR